MVYLIGKGYRVLAVGKAYDDLYAYIYGKREGYIEYKEIGVSVFKAPKKVEDFEEFNYYMERVGEEVIREALKTIGSEWD